MKMEKRLRDRLEKGKQLPPELEEWEKVISPSEHLLAPKFDELIVWQKIQNEMSPTPSSFRIPLILTGVAASFVLIIGFVFWNSRSSIKINYDEPAVVQLPKGSVVHVNKGSLISYQPNKWDQERTIRLEGEAYFEIAKNSIPFSVDTDYGWIRVVGTKFNVYSRKNYFKLACNEGKVNYVYNKDTFELTAPAGIQIVNNKLEKLEGDYAQPSWMDSFLDYQNFPIDLVLADLERYYAVKFKLMESVKGQKFNGKLPTDNMELALRILSQTMELSFQKISDQKVVVNIPR